MQLKSLEIHGFKSFADKTRFIFDSGITGVVGPNGCGKSNIVDSIRWVLGEQKTRKLRSEKMENIIFNGTTKRRKGGFAAVTLTFENTKNILPTEYTTVAVTRKLYRSGDSEYFINDIPCRLKDIHNLFLDTGIGPDSYAIIELKMVDEILNDKENSRRLLFEEAAGISKYKIRKKQTLRKLKDTESDLDRVEDVLYEINKQLKSLENQAKKARRYFDIKDKYRLVSSRHAWFAIQRLRQRYESIQSEEQGFEDRLAEVQSTIAQAEARSQELRREQIANEERLADSQKDLNAHIGRIREIEKEKSIRNERLKYLQQREIAITDQMEKERRQMISTQEQLEQVQNQAIGVRKDHAAAAETMEELKRLAAEVNERFEELQYQVEGYATEYQKVEVELGKLQKEREIKQIQIEGFRQEIDRNETDLETRAEEMGGFAGKLKELDTTVAELTAEVDGLRKQKDENDAALEASVQLMDQLKDDIYKKNRGVDARRNEFNLTKSLVENLEGFPESVKFLRKSAQWVKDAPLLSDIFSTDEANKVAFENLLDPYLSYYVVDTRADAYQAVRLLADAGKGRANFFILEELADYQAAPAVEMEGVVPALQVVDVAEKYLRLAEYLLDRVYLVPNDTRIPEDLPPDLMFITQTGSLMRKRYTLHGGSIGLFQGKRLGRAKNLKKLEKEIHTLERDLNRLKTDLHKQEHRHQELKSKNFAREIEEKYSRLQRRMRDLSVLKAREEEYQEFLGRVGKRTEEIEEQATRLEQEVAAAEPRIETLKQQIGEKKGILEEARIMLENHREELKERNQAFNEQNIRFIQLKNHVDLLEREETQKVARLRELGENEQKNKADLTETKENIHDLVQNSMQDDSEVVALYEEKKEKELRTEKLEQVTVQMRTNIQVVEDKIRQQRKKKDQLEQERGAVKERVTDIKLQLNSLKERMLVEFEVDISDLDEEELFPDGIAKTNAEAVEEEMLKLRTRLQKYGEINPMAVQAFDEMKERHDFIHEQRQDLLDAKQTLLNTISEIDKTATEKFMEAFDAIRVNFKEVFQHLFHPGDTCDLRLLQSEDPLESPIDIIAKPKGKRPLTINQLSGGEKTLTAISLLFAIYLLKPAPFCIFDEVDAPLDDANIDKFNNIIREFSKDSQFILVTHNKRTMAATNVMYGVTMQEQGISKVLPVDLVALDLQ